MMVCVKLSKIDLDSLAGTSSWVTCATLENQSFAADASASSLTLTHFPSSCHDYYILGHRLNVAPKFH
jgi:hypothetical protein